MSNPITSTSAASTAASGTSSSGTATSTSRLTLDPQMFLKMFTTQLTNQNPMSPMDSSSFLTQFSQISNVQTMNNLSDTLTSLNSSMGSLASLAQTNQAQGLLQHQVQYTDANGATQTTTVTALKFSPTGPMQLQISDGTTIGLSQITQVN